MRVMRRGVFVYDARMSKLEDELAWQMKAAGLPEPTRGVRFCPYDDLLTMGAYDRILELARGKARKRVYHFDFAWVDKHLYVEVDGGLYNKGGHARVRGMESDRLKSALATLLGWRGVRVTSHWVSDGRALTLVETLLAVRACEALSSAP